MSNKVDLTGQRFGRLVVLKDVLIVNNKEKIKCKCDCGNYKYIRKDSLKSGRTKSCGCFKNELAADRLSKISKGKDKYSDITDNRYGKLIAIKKEGADKSGSMVWLCKCDCGNYLKVTHNKLSKNHTRSCGCLQIQGEKEKTRIHSINKKRKINKNNKSGVVGVYWDKKGGKWNAEIQLAGESYRLGCFKNKQDAINARKEAEDKYFKPILDRYGKEGNYENTNERN